MKKIEFLEKLKENPNVIVEMEGEDNSKIFMKDIICSIKDDRLYLRNKEDLNFVVINLNLIREIDYTEKSKDIVIVIEDIHDTKIKISAI